MRPVIASPVYVVSSTTLATSIASVLVLQVALDLELDVTVLCEFGWWRNISSPWYVRLEEADVKYVVDLHVLSQLQVISCLANPLLYLEGADVPRHEFGCPNPLEADVSSAEKHFIIHLELYRSLSASIYLSICLYLSIYLFASICKGSLPLLGSFQELLGTCQTFLQGTSQSQCFWVLDSWDPQTGWSQKILAIIQHKGVVLILS